MGVLLRGSDGVHEKTVRVGDRGGVKASGCDLSECRLELGEHVRFGPFRGSISNFRRSFSF